MICIFWSTNFQKWMFSNQSIEQDPWQFLNHSKDIQNYTTAIKWVISVYVIL